MKKSIVLFISLFFIASLSILILRNLEDTNLYVQEQNNKIAKVQVLALIKNIKEDISGLIENNSSNISSFLPATIPYKVDGREVLITLKNNEKANINDLISNDKEKKAEFLNFLEKNGVYNAVLLEELLESEGIKNNKQLDNIIEEFVKQTYDDKILAIKDKLGFDNSKYELYIKVNYLNEFAKAYAFLDGNGGEKGFELSIK